MPRLPHRFAVAAAATLVLVLAGCGDGEPGGPTERAQVVVTTAILGDVVRNVVGDSADVTVLMPEGIDPHEFEPAPRDIARVEGADLLVTNGAGLEESLDAVIERAQAAGVEVFSAADHLPAGSGSESDPDPHFWTDPVAMASVVTALGENLVPLLGADSADGASRYADTLGLLHAENETAVATVPPERRVLVTGHQDLGPWARRYGFRVVGAVVPSASSTAEASAADISALMQAMHDSGVDVVFVETTTSQELAGRIAADTGATLVPIAVETLPADGSYVSLIRDLTGTIVSALKEPGS